MTNPTILNNQFPYITWADVETNGLDDEKNYLLEVAVLITDVDLNIVDEGGYTSPIYWPKTWVDNVIKPDTSEYVVNMHENTHLWDRVTSEGKLLSVVDDELQKYISEFIPSPRQSWLGGNSITLDRNFLKRNLPKTFDHLHYRSIDVSSWAGPISWWKGETYVKNHTHNAFDDIRESIEELRFFKNLYFS